MNVHFHWCLDEILWFLHSRILLLEIFWFPHSCILLLQPELQLPFPVFAVQVSEWNHLVFSCPEPLSHSLTDSGYFTDWHTKSDPRDLWPDHDLTIMKNTILETCDIWDTDCNSDNWKPESMTIKSDTGQHSQFLQFLATLVALHFTLVSESLSHSFELA